VRAVLVSVLSNDDKEDDDKPGKEDVNKEDDDKEDVNKEDDDKEYDDKEDDNKEDVDKDDNDVHQLITKQRKRMRSWYLSIAAVLGSRNRFKLTSWI